MQEKTKSIRVHVLRNVIVTLVLLFAVYVGYFVVWVPNVPQVPMVVEDSTTVFAFGDVYVEIEVARTPEEHKRGLSGRATLQEGRGMLFVYPTSDHYSFWMPDMHFALDIIWLDEGMRVVHIEENVTPASYPETFKPSAPARYVLEVPAGYAEMNGITVGTQGRVVKGVLAS